MTTLRRRDRCSGFTLAELLMVMVVVAVLYCISLSAIRAVDRTARKTAARAELKSIETGLKQYYAHYLSWPPLSEGASAEESPAEDRSAPVGRILAIILGGAAGGGGEAAASNPDKLIFVEFARLDRNGRPLNPWGAGGRYEKDKCLYHVALDTDGDNCVRFPSNATWSASSLLPSDRRYRGSVIVWTFNPELKAEDADYLVGSWQ